MKKEFIFRKAKIKDLKSILRLTFELFKIEDRKYDPTLNVNWPYGEGKKFFRRKIVEKDSFVEVVERKGKIMGYLCGGIFKFLPYFGREKAVYAELYYVIIKEKCRGKKFGQRLVKDFLKWCRKKKVDYVTVTASVKNKPAINFYRKSSLKDYALVLEKKLSKK